MKIAGYEPTENIEYVVIPRGNGKDLVFHCVAVLDDSDFEQLCPIPSPPSILKANGERSFDYEDEKYREKIGALSALKISWYVIRSISATPGLEWETVKLGDPETWPNYLDELRSLKLTNREINLIVEGVIRANALDESKIEEARKSFLAGLVAAPSE